MMKRLVAIFLTIYFLILSIGVGISTHLCGGRAISKAIFIEAPSCGHTAMTDGCDDHQSQKKSCCDHEYELVKLEGEYLFSSDFFLNIDLPLMAVVTYPLLDIAAPVLPAKYVFDTKPPPQGLSQRLALLQSYLC